MAELDARPQKVEVFGYGGDTLTIIVTAPASLVSEKTWSAQVRVARGDASPVAEFQITPPEVSNGPAYLTLTSADTARLTSSGSATIVRRRSAEGALLTIQQFVGEWDCQVAAVPGPDPVRTLVQGSITLEIDVTRAVV